MRAGARKTQASCGVSQARDAGSDQKVADVHAWIEFAMQS